MMRLCAVVLLFLSACPIGVQAEPAIHWSTGFHRLTFPDPLDDQPMHAIAFYPSTAKAGISRIGTFDVDATENAPVAMGRYPLLVLSHGNTGTSLALHDLVTSLASKGFVVVAVLHPGDNYKDQSRLGTLSNLYGRPMQISAAISATLADPDLSPYVHPKHVGVIGYSAGGETALILAGAEPDLDRLRRYCQERPDDHDACTQKGELIADRDDLEPVADTRVKALLLMAPLSLMFGRQTLAQVHVPVLLYSGEGDTLVYPEQNADQLARKLPVAPEFKLIPGAGHFVFMAPCTDEQLAAMPGLCTDADGVDREDIHRDLIDEARRFFSKTLQASPHSGLSTARQ
ncbi:dienelactone hydrolase family protein [Pseudomonas sp.]|uniref:alpha/beta hydrolase family protein n=1 Tax=Pseudomonas sp. TaxID=306 RepID=UPI00261B2685|nr:dienelactone hydrolase family protein [Pseudomonas sp.]